MTDVWIDDGSGSIELTDASGDVHIDDGSGSIKVSRVTGSIVVDDGSGSINVADVLARIKGVAQAQNMGALDVIPLLTDEVVARLERRA